jgi:rfaE bifunctional protein nucleotidyltransferase chain/domain
VTVVAPADKLATLDELVAERDVWRRQGRSVVLANGAFDLLHVGHVRYLAGAREAGDVLVVAVNSDASVRLAKGPTRPIVPQTERVELLSHLWMVDRMCLFDDLTVSPVLEALRPDIHAKGTDYTVDTVPEREVMQAIGGRTVIVGDPKDHATTDVIATILDRFGRRS